MSKYLIFGGQVHHPKGGACDLIDNKDSVDEAIFLAKNLIGQEVMKINTSKSYHYNNEKAFPADMNRAKVFVESFSSDNSSIAYSYVTDGGHTGIGSMRLDHAEKHFIEIKSE